MLKRIAIIVCLSVAISLPVSASVTFDEDGTTDTVTGVLDDYKTSNNVTLLVNSGAASYAAFSGHLNGDRQYGSSSGDSILFWSSKEDGTAISSAPTASDSSEFDSGWTAL